MTQRQRRGGFTLVELLITCALIVLILAIITQAFVIGLDSLGRLKSSGDLADKMRLVSNILRSDLRNDHFDGSLRLSDAHFGSSVSRVIGTVRRPAMGFFQVKHHAPAVSEGFGPDLVNSFRAPALPGGGHVLYMTVKLRGNAEKDFFSANVPAGSPVLGAAGMTYFDQPEDARRQSLKTDATLFSSQWAEVAYYLKPRIDTKSGEPIMARDMYLYTLHRKVRLLVPRSDTLQNKVPYSPPPPLIYPGLSWRQSGNFLGFKTPQEVISLAGRSLKEDIIDKDPSSLPTDVTKFEAEPSTMLLSDVISFTVQWIPRSPINPIDGQPGFAINPLQNQPDSSGNYDSNTAGMGIVAVVITIRAWDSRTEQTRQITIIEDM